MTSILQIYDQYQIMQSLQLHQLRVAAVGSFLMDKLGEKEKKSAVVGACLLHDMGNIIKFDLEHMAFPEFLQPEGVAHWREVQRDFVHKYGSSEEAATLKIVQEIGVESTIVELISAIGFDKLELNFQEKNLTKMICEYADNRVAPQGIVSLEARLADLECRYASRDTTPEKSQKRRKCQHLAKSIENYLLDQLQFVPESITEEGLGDTIAELRTFNF